MRGHDQDRDPFFSGAADWAVWEGNVAYGSKKGDGHGIYLTELRWERADDQWVRVEVTPGNMIVIPARTYHRFYLTEAKQIRCMRLFANHNGWAPLYRGQET